MHSVEDPANPNRCKGTKTEGQCWNLSEEGSEYCLACGGVNRTPARNLRGYLLTRVEDQRRLAQLSEGDDLKSLRDEVVLAKMMLERRWNLAQTDAEYLAGCGQLNNMFLTVERLKKSLLVIEKTSEALMSRDAAIGIAQSLLKIIFEEIVVLEGWEPVADRVLQRFEAAMTKKPVTQTPLALTNDLETLES